MLNKTLTSDCSCNLCISFHLSPKLGSTDILGEGSFRAASGQPHLATARVDLGTEHPVLGGWQTALALKLHYKARLGLMILSSILEPESWLLYQGNYSFSAAERSHLGSNGGWTLKTFSAINRAKSRFRWRSDFESVEKCFFSLFLRKSEKFWKYDGYEAIIDHLTFPIPRSNFKAPRLETISHSLSHTKLPPTLPLSSFSLSHWSVTHTSNYWALPEHSSQCVSECQCPQLKYFVFSYE